MAMQKTAVGKSRKPTAKKKKLTSRQLQALRTKDDIYEGALKVFGELGYEATSIEAITTAAGVSIGSFYTYFSSKEQILLHTYEKSEILYRHAFEQTATLPYPENLYAFIEISYSGLELRGKEIMYGVTSNILSASFKTRIIDRKRAFFLYLYELLESGKKSGKLPRGLNTADCVTKLFMMLTGVEVYWCLTNFENKISDIAVDSVRALIDGLTMKKT